MAQGELYRMPDAGCKIQDAGCAFLITGVFADLWRRGPN